EFAQVRLAWSLPEKRFDLRADQVVLREPDGSELANLSEIAIDLDWGSLLRGDLRPTDLVVIGPQVVLERGLDGGLSLNLAGMAPAAGQVEALLPGAEAREPDSP